MIYDRVIIGAGIFGLYAASQLIDRGYTVLVIEKDESYFRRGSYINQARLHNGYHYPRSLSTAKKSAKYFSRFLDDYKDCTNTEFDQIYAVATNYSWTNAEQFKKFCKANDILCEVVDKKKYFDSNMIEEAYLTKEYSFDARLIGEKLFEYCISRDVKFSFNTEIEKCDVIDKKYELSLTSGLVIKSEMIINATYAGINNVHKIFGFDFLPIKYELCEVVLCKVQKELENVGVTVMDGPFFSVMPFGKTGLHSITTVSKTPHYTSYSELPTFNCQKLSQSCSPDNVQNCNHCEVSPKSSYQDMLQMVKMYTNDKIKLLKVKSLFTLKPILIASEIDDSRPTIIRKYSSTPDFYTVFSGKLNTIYDMDEILK